MTSPHLERALTKRVVSKPTDPDGLILEAWAQGFMVGALIIMSCITAANMRKGILLHKIILVELLFGIWHGFFIFNHPPVYGWYLSVSAIFLNTSWSLHNVIAWMKNKPFLTRNISLVYIISVAVVQPYWVLEIYANFTYFNNINELFLHTRPYEALFRDPWWIFTTISLFYNIKTRYEMNLKDILRISPRFAIMLMAMILSICFLIVDICSVTGAFDSTLPVGINPFWKLSFVFKCLTDSVILDDFKTALDRLRAFKISRLGSFAVEGSAAEHSWRNGLTEQHHPWSTMDSMPSPDGKMTNTKSVFAPQEVTTITERLRGGESASGQTGTESTLWPDNKITSDHVENPVTATQPRDIEENVGGAIAGSQDLRGHERSWFDESSGERRRLRGRRGDVDAELDSVNVQDGKDIKMTTMR